MSVLPGGAEFDRLSAAAEVHYGAGRLEEAKRAYRAAVALRPGDARALHNLAVVLARLGEPRRALEYFDAALAAAPNYVSAHYNRGLALESIGKRVEACAAFARTINQDPGHYAAHLAMGLSRVALGQRGQALDHFARTYELRRGDDRSGMARESLTSASSAKLFHDAEQLRYLARQGRDAQRFQALASNYERVVRTFPAHVAPLSNADLQVLGDDYNTAIHLADAPEIGDGALAPRPDRQAVVDIVGSGAGAAYCDHLLSPRAFSSLRRYLLASTIWHDFKHIDGFVAAYLEDGLACPLLLQIADELRAALPELLESHPLRQAWAFKAVEPTKAIDVHCDDAAISVNFWMTPSEANSRPGRGGLKVCLVPPPSDWAPAGYDGDRARNVPFLAQNAQNCLTVPYRGNRAVIFQSRLLHCSDAPYFAEGYENHRINVTLLFGRPRAASPLWDGRHPSAPGEEAAACR